MSVENRTSGVGTNHLRVSRAIARVVAGLAIGLVPFAGCVAEPVEEPVEEPVDAGAFEQPEAESQTDFCSYPGCFTDSCESWCCSVCDIYDDVECQRECPKRCVKACVSYGQDAGLGWTSSDCAAWCAD